MSKKDVDLRGFQKIKSDQNSTVLKHSKDGHEIKINHASVPPGVLDGLNRLKVYGYAEGGEVSKKDDDLSDLVSDQPQPEYIEKPFNSGILEANENPFSIASAHADDGVDSVTMENSSADIPSISEDSPVPSGEDGLSGQMGLVSPGLIQKSMETQITGAKQIADAQIDLAKETQNIEANRLKQQVAEKEQHAKEMAPVMAELEASKAWIEANPENSKRFVDNMSTGSKISTVIGLLVGGIGAGLSKGPNLAAKQLDDMIERDINDQKSKIATKQGLLAYNLKKMGNINDAYNLTKMQANEMVAAQLKIASAKATSAAAVGTMNAAIGKIMEQNLTLGSKLMAGKNPAAKYVQGMGYARTPEEAKIINEMVASNKTAKDSIDKLLKINNVTGKSLSPGLRAEAESLSALLVGQLNKALTGGGPMSETERKIVESVAKNPTDFFSLDSSNKKRLETLKSVLDNKLNATASQAGLQVQSQPQYKTVNGVKYMRGANGEAIRVNEKI